MDAAATNKLGHWEGGVRRKGKILTSGQISSESLCLCLDVLWWRRSS